MTLELLHQLLHLPSPPQVLYLPPVASPLSDDLLTILQTLRLSATTKSPAAQLHCDALPRTPRAIRAFVKQWAVNPAGTGEGGRRLDAIVWADGWKLDIALTAFQATGVKAKDNGEDEDDNEDSAAEWTVQESRFHLLTALLPLIIKAPMERSIRLVNLVSPFYAAAIPTVDSSSDASQSQTARGRSAILQTGVDSWKDILLWKHLQKILDALASTVHPHITGVPVPTTEGDPTDPSLRVAETAVEKDSSPVEDARRLPGPEDGQAAVDQKDKEQSKRIITVQSNILALSVVMPFNRWGVIRPMLGFREAKNKLGLLVYVHFVTLLPT